MTKPILITVNTNQRFVPWRVAVSISLQVGVIGVGVLTGSVAMQWAGFILCALLLFAMVLLMAKQTTGVTISAARAYLDKLEANEANE